MSTRFRVRMFLSRPFFFRRVDAGFDSQLVLERYDPEGVSSLSPFPHLFQAVESQVVLGQVVLGGCCAPMSLYSPLFPIVSVDVVITTVLAIHVSGSCRNPTLPYTKIERECKITTMYATCT